MNNLRVALLQIMPEITLDLNQQKGFESCRRAKAMGADIALFPEMWSIIPTQFYVKGSPLHCDDPFQQAEQTYHLIKIGVKENG